MNCTTSNTAGKCQVLRVVRGHAIEWHGKYPDGLYGNDFANQFSFLPGAFDASLAGGGDIALTMDMDGVPFARRSDGTLRITSDAVGLLVEADLRDNPRNHVLCNRIDAGKVKGWSHQFWAAPSWGRVRSVKGVRLTEFHRADLLELTIVIRKRPRQRVRKTSIFLSGGPQKPLVPLIEKHCCCPPIRCGACEEGDPSLPTTITVSDGTGSVDLVWTGGSLTEPVFEATGASLAGCSNAEIALVCQTGTAWYFTIIPAVGDPVFCAPTGTCDPFDLSCTIVGCDDDTYTLTFTPGT
ncbi:MAG TPA: HK97 family phage prohead protease [Planctomycetaceae bacterium]|nr:HK97 family phage prohead protease [Planctomycetaceae bacterium]